MRDEGVVQAYCCVQHDMTQHLMWARARPRIVSPSVCDSRAGALNVGCHSCLRASGPPSVPCYDSIGMRAECAERAMSLDTVDPLDCHAAEAYMVAIMVIASLLLATVDHSMPRQEECTILGDT